jgi:hypothetical protein
VRAFVDFFLERFGDDPYWDRPAAPAGTRAVTGGIKRGPGL